MKVAVGRRFGSLKVLRFLQVQSKQFKWLCRCVCGKELAVFSSNIRRCGSCGCKWRQKAARRMRRNTFALVHGARRQASFGPLYNSWRNMKLRCRGSMPVHRRRYSERGIWYDPSWDDFQNFKRDVGTGWFPGAHLHRLDVDNGYCLGNVVWMEPSEHAKLHRRLQRLKGEGAHL